MGENPQAAEEGIEHETVLTGDGRFGRRLGLSVGTFLVMAIGFVLTLFFVAQFVGGDSGGFSSGLLSNVGVSAGYGLAILFAPFGAVLVGVLIGREDGERAALDAGVSTAAAFVVMFFAILVIATSLGGDTSGAATSAGPLVGFTIGVGITGAGAAAVARSDDVLLASVTDHPSRRPFVLAIGTYLVFAIGYAVAVFLAASLAAEGNGVGLAAVGFGSVTTALGLGLLLSPAVAILVGLFVGRDDVESPGLAAGVSGITNAVGFAVMLVLIYLVVMVLKPEGLTAGQFPLGPLLGFVVGVGLTGAGAAYVAGVE